MSTTTDTDPQKPRQFFGRGTEARLSNGTLSEITHNPDNLNCPCKSCIRHKKAKSRPARTAKHLLNRLTTIAPIGPIDASDPDGVIVLRDKSPRSRVAEWVILRSQGFSNKQIAAQIGINYETLKVYIYRGCKEGWLKLHSPADRLEHVIAPRVVDNIEHFINAKDKVMTIEAAKGIGLFKSHQAVRVEGQSSPTMLALKIEMIGEPLKGGGNIVGTPKVIDVDPYEAE